MYVYVYVYIFLNWMLDIVNFTMFDAGFFFLFLIAFYSFELCSGM